MKKTVLLLAVAVLVAVFFAFDLNQVLTLDGLKASTALSLPGAVILTLAAGALFGLAGGTLLVSFASSIGATLAFLASRCLFRDFIQACFGDRMRAINDGMAKDGPMYLFTLRLVPLFPFFLVNLLMGLTPIRKFSYYWISQLGMLAGTLVYINAGTELAKVTSLSGIVSPGLVFSFVLLGVFPMVAKKFINFLQARRVYAKWQRPAQFDRSLVVIGGGAAGLVTSYIAAAVKAKVTLVEAHKMGVQRLSTRSIVIAAGARPLVPALPGLEEVGYVTSDTLGTNLPSLMQRPRAWWCWAVARSAVSSRKVLPG